MDPILRNTLRYTISAREYETLHRYVISRSRILRKRAPTVNTVEKYINGEGDRRSSVSRDPPKGKGKGKGKDKAPPRGLQPGGGGGDNHNVRAIRHALRVFVATGLGAKAYEILLARVKGQKESSSSPKKQPFYKSSPLRLSLSLSTILLLYRLLFRFFTRLRAQLLDPAAAPFRQRNPRTSNTLTSPYAPAVGASLAGLALGIFPAQQLRLTIMISVMFRALEFGWNLLEDEGSIWGFRTRAGGKGLVKRERPWWFGSWMLQPVAMGQLLHATVFDRESSPAGFLDLIFKHTTTYLHSAPENLPSGVKWPNPWDIIDNLAEMAKLNWPPFTSPTLFPNQPTLPATLTALAPITSQAYPIITSLSCASLHPADPSCLRNYVTFWVRSFPHLGRFFLIFYSMLMLPRALRLTTFATGAMSTAWASICFFQTWLPRTFLPTQRFFLGGFIAGLWAFVERREGRSIFLYTARTSVDSLWKVGVKRRWWRAMRGGDVWLFALALAITGAVYERDARAIREANVRKGISWLRGTGFRDWGLEEEDELEVGDEKEE
ncbi:hypothetical protein ONZ43_g2776 [Nemania bipapillata]|uniref:Uncharacterized protein n=1 Tax=Nemania bipapillata TaxID=110536 RepID=A0ACC2IZB3_9PEZI|nr:hypothetical protein ONZ43_g2776 [Nemania bipapillata]